jgi:ribonuclease D
MTYKLFKDDLPDDVEFGPEVAVDTEALGLNNSRDRLCLVQIYFGSGEAFIVHFDSKSTYNSPNLVKLLSDVKILKIFHYARFDMAILQKTFGVRLENVYCTKIASRIARTYSDIHGLKALIREFFNIDISKKEQGSYWGGDDVTEEQLRYAANDVLFLHRIKEKLNVILENENRKDLVNRCFNFLQTRVDLDLLGWANVDVFCHQ